MTTTRSRQSYWPEHIALPCPIPLITEGHQDSVKIPWAFPLDVIDAGDCRPAEHRVGAVVHGEGLVVAQTRVSDKTNEITSVEPLLRGLDIEGAVITGDAMFAIAPSERPTASQTAIEAVASPHRRGAGAKPSPSV